MKRLLLLFVALLWTFAVAAEDKPKPEDPKRLDGDSRPPTVDQITKYIDGQFGSFLKAPAAGVKLPLKLEGWQNLRPTFNPLFRGGNISGGGSVIETKGGWKLLDTYVFPQFKPKEPEAGLEASRLTQTPFHQAVGMDILNLEESGPFRLVVNRLNEIAPQQARFASLLLGILKYKLKFIFTFREVKRYSDF